MLSTIYIMLGLLTLMLVAFQEGTELKWCSSCNQKLGTIRTSGLLEPYLLFLFWPVVLGIAVLHWINQLYYYIAYGSRT